MGTSDHVRRWAFCASFVCLLCWLGYREWYYAAWMDDDAFISFRYARNMAQGLGLVFNPGERVEGYSNFLWTIALAGFYRLGADLPAAAQLLGAFSSFLAILLLVWRGADVLPPDFSDRPNDTRWFGSLAAMILCVLEAWAAWAVGGLENSFGALLVLAAFLSYFRGLSGNGSAIAASGLLCALAALVHPSYVLFGLVLGSYLLLRKLRGRTPLSELTAYVAPILAIGVPYLLWKYDYYGHLLPNTFHAKVGYGWAVIGRGVRYYGDVLRGMPVIVLFGAVTPVLLLAGKVRDPRPWLLFTATAAYSAYSICIGGEAFPAFRLLIVTLPLQLLLVQYIVALLASRMNRAVPAASLGLFLATIVAVAIPCYRSPNVRVLDHAVRTDMLGLFRSAALMMKQRFPSEILLAGSGAGVIPYYSEFRFLDTLGLTDAHIGKRLVADFGQKTAGHEKGDGRYVFERGPDVIMFGSGTVSGFEPCFLSDFELVAIPEFHTRYEQVALELHFTPRNQAELVGYVPLYVRRGLPTR